MYEQTIRDAIERAASMCVEYRFVAAYVYLDRNGTPGVAFFSKEEEIPPKKLESEWTILAEYRYKDIIWDDQKVFRTLPLWLNDREREELGDELKKLPKGYTLHDVVEVMIGTNPMAYRKCQAMMIREAIEKATEGTKWNLNL